MAKKIFCLAVVGATWLTLLPVQSSQGIAPVWRMIPPYWLLLYYQKHIHKVSRCDGLFKVLGLSLYFHASRQSTHPQELTMQNPVILEKWEKQQEQWGKISRSLSYQLSRPETSLAMSEARGVKNAAFTVLNLCTLISNTEVFCNY